MKGGEAKNKRQLKIMTKRERFRPQKTHSLHKFLSENPSYKIIRMIDCSKSRYFFRLIDCHFGESRAHTADDKSQNYRRGLRCEIESPPSPAKKLLPLARARGREREKEKERERKGPRNPFDPNIRFNVHTRTLKDAASRFLLRFPIEEELNFPNEGSSSGNLPSFVALSTFPLSERIQRI